MMRGRVKKKTIRDIDVQGKRVFARLDWNVPVEDGVVTDAYRIEATRDTLKYLLDHDCRVVIASHRGRPDGKTDPKFSLQPVAAKATEVLGFKVNFASDCVGPEATQATRDLPAGEVLLLENVRFHPEEEANDPAFAKLLAGYGDIFVYDAFASYRPHASTEGVAHLLPGVAGLLVEKEVDYITQAIEHPNRPLVAVIGGAKVSTKLDILTHLIAKVDAMLLTGPIANTFALTQGRHIGKSIAEPDAAPHVKELMTIAKRENTMLLIPEEVVVSRSLEKADHLRTIRLDDIQDDDYIVDAAPAYGEVLKRTIYDFIDFDGKATVIWNGPLGITEVTDFQAGSLAMAHAIIESKAVSIIGGGDTAGFIDEVKLHDQFTWVSTGGGASLELMSGKGLPCVDALQDK
jgi:phosphoglycerate kinase